MAKVTFAGTLVLDGKKMTELVDSNCDASGGNTSKKVSNGEKVQCRSTGDFNITYNRQVTIGDTNTDEFELYLSGKQVPFFYKNGSTKLVGTCHVSACSGKDDQATNEGMRSVTLECLHGSPKKV